MCSLLLLRMFWGKWFILRWSLIGFRWFFLSQCLFWSYLCVLIDNHTVSRSWVTKKESSKERGSLDWYVIDIFIHIIVITKSFLLYFCDDFSFAIFPKVYYEWGNMLIAYIEVNLFSREKRNQTAYRNEKQSNGLSWAVD